MFLGKSFHEVVEKTPPSGIIPYYCIVYADGEAIGICYYQLKMLKMAEALKLDDENGFSKAWKGFMLRWINFYSLVCGNAMVTGQYGFRFLKSIDRDRQYELMSRATDHLVSKLKVEDQINVGPVLCKDYYERQLYSKNSLDVYTKFTVQPSMIFDINKEWSTFEDYLSAMRTKYRTRVKRAIKKLGCIEVRELSLFDISNYKSRMNDLYLYVANQASFNLFHLHVDYFYELKNHLGDALKVVGYFDRTTMVGFYTIIINNANVDAHFLGYDKSINGPNQLYLNMLYDMIHRGIEQGSEKIFMSRTALEIKSSTGAEAHDMYCYLKHTKPLFNNYLPKILDGLVPHEEWIPRSPFKEDTE